MKPITKKLRTRQKLFDELARAESRMAEVKRRSLALEQRLAALEQRLAPVDVLRRLQARPQSKLVN